MTDLRENGICERCCCWYGEDPALIKARTFPRGSTGYYAAMKSWTGESCACPGGPHKEPVDD